MRTVTALFLLWMAGCSCDAEARSPDAGRPASSAPAPLDAQQRVLHEWLRAQAISDTQFAAPVLYVWLSQAEMDQMRGGTSIATLADASALDDAFPVEGCAVCDRLREPARAGRRRAWTSPWASRSAWSGTDGERDHLARVELRPESVIVVYDARTTPPTFRASTERGATAPWAEAMQVPDLWAAVLFLHEVTLDDGTRAPAREMVLVSPSMIGGVTMGTPEIANELRTERLRLTRLARDTADSAPAPTASTLEHAWAAQPEPEASLERLFASVLVTGASYAMSREVLVPLVARLDDRSDAFEWHTTIPSEPRPQYFP